MKRVLEFILIVAVVITMINCAKEELESNKGSNQAATTETELRSGGGDVVFFRKSLSTDNYLVRNSDGTTPARKYVAYNDRKVEFVKFDASAKPKATISGVLCSHYNLTVKYTDGTQDVLTAYSKDTVQSFSFIPTKSLLHQTNECNKISWEQMPGSLTIYNEFRNADGKSHVWEISCGEKVVGQKWKETWNKTANLFTLQHAH
jgi:hypothetical protein